MRERERAIVLKLQDEKTAAAAVAAVASEETILLT